MNAGCFVSVQTAGSVNAPLGGILTEMDLYKWLIWSALHRQQQTAHLQCNDTHWRLNQEFIPIEFEVNLMAS